MTIVNDYEITEKNMAYGKCLKKFVNIINEIFGEEIKITQAKNFTAAKEVIDKMDTIFNIEEKYPNTKFEYDNESDDTAPIIGDQSVEIQINSDDIKASIVFYPYYIGGKPKAELLAEFVYYNTELEINTISDIESVISKKHSCLSKKEKSFLNKIIKTITNNDLIIKYITIRP